MIKVNFRFEVSILICKSFIHVLIHFPWTFEELNLYELLAKTTGARLNSLAHRNVFHKWKISYINQVECAIAKTIISSSQEKQQNNSRGISTWSENIWFMCYVWVSFRCKWNINTIQRFDNSDCWRQTNKIKSIGVLNSTASTHSRRSISTYVDRRKIVISVPRYLHMSHLSTRSSHQRILVGVIAKLQSTADICQLPS